MAAAYIGSPVQSPTSPSGGYTQRVWVADTTPPQMLLTSLEALSEAAWRRRFKILKWFKVTICFCRSWEKLSLCCVSACCGETCFVARVITGPCFAHDAGVHRFASTEDTILVVLRLNEPGTVPQIDTLSFCYAFRLWTARAQHGRQQLEIDKHSI